MGNLETTPSSIFESELTQSQLLLWIGQEMNPESPMYNMVLTFSLEGYIDVSAFRTAFRTLIEKSDALRMVIEKKEGQAIQKVLNNLEYEIELLNFSKEQNPQEVYELWLEKRTQHIFDLSRCMFDCVLIQISDQHFIWYLNQHHLSTDAWSTSVIYKEMASLYSMALSGKLKESKTLPAFKDYISYEKNIQSSNENLDARNYWQQKLKESPLPPTFFDNVNSNSSTYSIRLGVDLGRERSQKLRMLAKEKELRSWTEHLTLYNIFATTLFAYLYKISGQEKLIIGSPAHNRASKTFKETIGIFIEIFPLTTEIEKGESFFSLMKKMQIESNGFLRYAQTGASSAVLSRSFNVFFNYINASYGDFNEIPMNSEWIHPNHCDPAHHLRLQVHDFDESGSIQLYFDLNCAVFNEEQRSLVSSHFLTLLDAFIEDKTQKIDKTSVLTSFEYQKLVVDFNKNKYEDNEERNIIELVEATVEKTPDAIGLIFGEEQFTYRELNEKANQLAHYLIEQNIGLGKQVAICLKRSPEYVISVLAVLKTGATFIPIPSNYPNERVLYLLADSEASLLISHSNLTACMNLSSATLHIDRFMSNSDSYSNVNLSRIIPSASTAFLIYTSGSTGNPKGVMITNKALTNYIKWTEHAYINHPKPSIPLFTTIGFDITANSVFLPLICGGTIHVYQESNLEVDLSIIDVVEDDQVDFIKLTPAHLNFLKGKELKGSRLKVMVVTGDEFKTELGQYIHRAYGGEVLIYDEYGPSEATIGCIYHQFTPDIKKPTVPIGLPIHNMSAYILDRSLQPVPQGVVGELYLGGIGLAAGYWNRPELTNQKFISNPFVVNEKMYQTGDLARINNQGIIEFLGRIDFQVKINGHRIELGEIESKIVEYGSIKSCAVVVIEDEQNFKQLTAFFTASSLIVLSKIQEHLALKLPRYMVPTHYRKLDELPLSPNGKVNRRALKALEVFSVDTKEVYVAPQTEFEEIIAEIWQSILKIPKIGINDKFIDLGGESLKAIQIATRIAKELELEIKLNKIFEFPTIASLSKYIEAYMEELLAMEE